MHSGAPAPFESGCAAVSPQCKPAVIPRAKGDAPMIILTRINKVEHFFINEDRIETVEETPDTIISLESGHKYVVMESAQEVNDRIVAQKQRILNFRNPPL